MGESKMSQIEPISQNSVVSNDPNQTQNENPGAARYGDPRFSPRDGPQLDPPNVCETCPYTIAALEHDKCQFTVYDLIFRNLVLLLARAQGWEVKENKRDIWIKLDKMNLQLGLDSVTIYTNEPEDLSWIGKWVEDNFSAIYHDIPGLVRRVTHPLVIGQDESTIIIFDEKTKEAIDQVIDPHKKPDGVLYLKSPNAITPGLKIYCRKDTGLMRCELVSNNKTQVSSAVRMRHDLLTLLTKIGAQPGLFWDFISTYYSSVIHQEEFSNFFNAISEVKSLVEQTNDRLNAKLDEVIDRFTHHHLENERTVKREKDPDDAVLVDIDGFLQGIPEEDFTFDGVCRHLTEHFNLPDGAARFFMTAYGLWASTLFRGMILIDSVRSEIIRRFGEGAVQSESIPYYLQRLRAKGLLAEKPGYDIWFSRAGTLLCKKLNAQYQRGC